MKEISVLIALAASLLGLVLAVLVFNDEPKSKRKKHKDDSQGEP